MRMTYKVGRLAGFEPTSTETKRGIYIATSGILSPISLLLLPLSYSRHFAYSLRYQRFNCHADTLKNSQYLASFTIAFKGVTRTYPLRAALQRWCFYGFYQALL